VLRLHRGFKLVFATSFRIFMKIGQEGNMLKSAQGIAGYTSVMVDYPGVAAVFT
jgi:hypothetical protein